MSKKYRYIRLENISNFEGWDLVEIIPAKSNEYYDMCVMCLDDAPSQRDEEIEMLKSYKSLYEDLKAENLETIKAIKGCKAEAIKEFAERLKTVMYGYYDCLKESIEGRPYKGDTLMDYEVVNMIEDSIENLVEIMTEERK